MLWVLVRVIDDGNLVFGGQNSIYWDGKNTLGKLMGYGTYQYRIMAKDWQETLHNFKGAIGA
jgi:flagellar hook assembly protein FlgD